MDSKAWYPDKQIARRYCFKTDYNATIIIWRRPSFKAKIKLFVWKDHYGNTEFG